MTTFTHPETSEHTKLDELCIPMPDFIKSPLCLTLPTGTTICPNLTYADLNAFEYAQKTLDMAHSALGQLQPFFEILEAVTLVHNCFEAVLKTLGPPPDPRPLQEALSALTRKMIRLAKMTPAYSVPVMMVQLIDMFIQSLYGTADELDALATQAQRLRDAESGFEHNSGVFRDVIACITNSLTVHQENLQKALPLSATFHMINALAKLADLGAPFPLPVHEPLSGEEPRLMAKKLRDIATTLRTARESIPV